eukprot:823640-Amphidinium_carterae.1
MHVLKSCHRAGALARQIPASLAVVSGQRSFAGGGEIDAEVHICYNSTSDCTGPEVSQPLEVQSHCRRKTIETKYHNHLTVIVKDRWKSL